MTGRNVPAGWGAFCALRQKPAPIPRAVHGNWRHGGRSESGREQMRQIRFCVRVLRRPGLLMTLPDSFPEGWLTRNPAGWRAYAAWRSTVAPEVM